MKLFEGNSYELIKTIPDNSIDLIVTDPPYLIESTNAGSNSELSKSIQKMNDQLAEGVLTDGITNDILEEFVRGRLKFEQKDENGTFKAKGCGQHDSMIVVF